MSTPPSYLHGLFSLEGKVALITGSTRGLGWAMAQALAGAGAHVVVHGRKAAEAAVKADVIVKAGGSASPAAFDVADEAAAVKAIAEIVSGRGRLDVLVNNAGVVHRGKFVDVETDAWRDVVETNLTACFVLAREAARHMGEQGGGRIINIGSVMSAIARWGAPAYITTKHGLIGLTRAIAVEFGRKGITCNAIAPGFVRTELNLSQQQHPKTNEQVIARTPLARWGDPQELAGAVVFLASGASSYVNGLTLFVDGGVTAAF
jgi:gluconate 5-dehydrogenase